MTDQSVDKRDNLLKVMLVALEFRRRNSPWPHIYEGAEDRYKEFHAKSTEKKFLKGLEEAAREIGQSAGGWPSDERARFYKRVRDETGLSFFSIVGNIEKTVEKILSREEIRGEDDIRVLIDYVSDYPDGQYFDAARTLLSTHGQ